VRYGVRLGDIGLLIGRDTLSEVIAQAAIYPIPNTPPWLAGLMNLRGNLVPVFDLHLLLGLEPPADRPRRFLLVLGRGDGAVGMYVDGLPQAVATGEGLGQLPPLPEVLREHVQTGYVDQGALWLEFPHEALFSTLGQRLGAARARRESVVPRADG
jgi:twitching motility protein PilI